MPVKRHGVQQIRTGIENRMQNNGRSLNQKQIHAH